MRNATRSVIVLLIVSLSTASSLRADETSSARHLLQGSEARDAGSAGTHGERKEQTHAQSEADKARSRRQRLAQHKKISNAPGAARLADSAKQHGHPASVTADNSSFVAAASSVTGITNEQAGREGSADGNHTTQPQVTSGGVTANQIRQAAQELLQLPAAPQLKTAAGNISEINQLAQASATALFQKFNGSKVQLSSKLSSFNYSQSEFRKKFKGDQILNEAELWSARQYAVKLATKETWAVYERYAFGDDELMPVSLRGVNRWGGFGVMILDSIDTLYLMGLQEEYSRAAHWISESMSLEQQVYVSLFEITIRALGGLLSIYELTEEAVFLQKAAILAAKLMPAFQNGVYPANWIQINTNQMGGGTHAQLSELGSLVLELYTLADRTGVDELKALAEYPIKVINELYPDQGVLPTAFLRENGRLWQDLNSNSPVELTMGGNADSYYEYLLKMWLVTKNEMYRAAWERSMDNAVGKLFQTRGDGLSTVGKVVAGRPVFILEHLTCFLPGNLVLGAKSGAVDSVKAAHFLAQAALLTESCWQIYRRTASGLAPDDFHEEGPQPTALKSQNMANELRPEVVESLFYMWWATKEDKWRSRGWEIFTAFMLYARTPQGAFARTLNVNVLPPVFDDQMPTFWTAETLKYLWLLFSADDVLPLDEWVFNTEAHPFRVRKLQRHTNATFDAQR